jgi:hypothetical protein
MVKDPVTDRGPSCGLLTSSNTETIYPTTLNTSLKIPIFFYIVVKFQNYRINSFCGRACGSATGFSVHNRVLYHTTTMIEEKTMYIEKIVIVLNANHLYRRCHILYRPMFRGDWSVVFSEAKVQSGLTAYMLQLRSLLFLCSVRPLGHHRMCKPKESLFLRTDFIVTCNCGRISSVFFPGHL